MVRPNVSHEVVIRGPTMTAGSKPMRATANGSIEPSVLASVESAGTETLTEMHVRGETPMKKNRQVPTKHARRQPCTNPAAASTATTCTHERRRPSRCASERMTVEAACPPELPACPISSGTK